jgi:hypothetical protein
MITRRIPQSLHPFSANGARKRGIVFYKTRHKYISGRAPFFSGVFTVDYFARRAAFFICFLALTFLCGAMPFRNCAPRFFRAALPRPSLIDVPNLIAPFKFRLYGGRPHYNLL